MFPEGVNVPAKMMFILTEKQGHLYGIALFSPNENFDAKLKEIKPTLDYIQLTNSTVMN